MNERIYDVIIIGGGPAGWSAGIYASRAGLNTLLIEKGYVGGQMAQTSTIDNYPGFEDGIDGFMLGRKMQIQAEKYGTKFLNEEVVDIKLEGENKIVITNKGEFYSRNIIIATGAKHKKMGLDKEDKYTGRGVHYCATCDGVFYKNKVVAVVGGGNTAVEDALFLSKLCKKVIIIHRRDEFRATKIYLKQLMDTENIELKMNSEVKELFIEDNVFKGVKIFNNKKANEEELPIDGLFVAIGVEPNTELLKNKIELDKTGYIVTDENTKTSVDGIYAVGDVRTKQLRQVVTAVADGAISAYEIERKSLKNKGR